MPKEIEPPEWLLHTDEDVRALRDHDAFLRRSAEALRAVLREARRSPYRAGRFSASTQTKLATSFVTIALVSASSNFAFVEIVGVALLVLLSRYNGARIARTLCLPIQAGLISVVILAPSLFFGQTRSFWTTPCKTVVVTTVLSLLTSTTNWNRFSCAFKSFGAPDALVYIFDLTLKYVVVLCEIGGDAITSALLRSVGRNRHKARSLGGIAGVAFLHAQDHAREQFDAMTCRCFSGNYRRFRSPFRAVDYLACALIALEVALFIYLEICVRCSS